MFWRRTKEEKDTKIELPALEKLEHWVTILISSLKLKKGSFTILPAYGGIILFIKNEGISWIPYNEIREAIGKVDKRMVAESSSVIGSVAVGSATGALIPILLVQGILKGSYRTLANPPPVISRSYLKSMIKEVLIEEKKIARKLLKTFEKDPYKNEATDESNDNGNTSTYRITITRKFLDLHKKKSKMIKVMVGIKSFFIRSVEPVFSIPEQSNVKIFSEILEANLIPVVWKQVQKDDKNSNDFENSELTSENQQ